MTSPGITGIHHVTAIAGDPQENVDFYAGVLGMRFVKRSVNQDDPGTYHLFYADGEGHPGSDLTFFPWPNGAPGHNGSGLTNEVALAVPLGSLAYWRERLARRDVVMRSAPETFCEKSMSFFDPHGLKLSLVESHIALERVFTPWEGSSVPIEHQVRGIHAVRVVEARVEPTVAFVTGALGMREVAQDGTWTRFAGTDATSGYLEVRVDNAVDRGSWGVGTVHHVAWRVKDDDHQLALRAAAAQHRVGPTPVIDRFWFRSVYFREPGGVLFELATDGPGFAIDEPLATLGEALVLPPWLEPHRAAIMARLPPLTPPRKDLEAKSP
jgi:glyoxalase family protein